MAVRPPPLQLKIDNRFDPTQYQHLQKARSFFAELYRANWRNAVLAVTCLNALRFSLSALNAYHDIPIDDTLNFPHLAGVSRMLCGMYLTAGLIDVFGVFSVSMRRLDYIHLYTCLAIFSALLVTVAGAISALTFFVFSDDVVNECIMLAMGGELAKKSIFRGRPWPLAEQKLSNLDATRACDIGWTNEAPSQIIAVFLFSLLPSIIYCLLVYTYYRQLTDPTHGANLCENGVPNSSIRMDLRYSYSPLYVAPSVTTTRNIHMEQASAPMKGREERWQKKKQYDHLPTLMKSESSPMHQYLLTPGPPSFGPSRVYAYESYGGRLGSGDSLGYLVDKTR